MREGFQQPDIVADFSDVSLSKLFFFALCCNHSYCNDNSAVHSNHPPPCRDTRTLQVRPSRLRELWLGLPLTTRACVARWRRGGGRHASG